MTLLLLWNKKERFYFILKCIKNYIDWVFNIDEIHYILEFVIWDTIWLDDLVDKDFYNLCESFKDDYINFYNDLPVDEIDIDPSNYVLKDEFDLWLRKFYKDLLLINEK